MIRQDGELAARYFEDEGRARTVEAHQKWLAELEKFKRTAAAEFFAGRKVPVAFAALVVEQQILAPWDRAGVVHRLTEACEHAEFAAGRLPEAIACYHRRLAEASGLERRRIAGLSRRQRFARGFLPCVFRPQGALGIAGSSRGSLLDIQRDARRAGVAGDLDGNWNSLASGSVVGNAGVDLDDAGDEAGSRAGVEDFGLDVAEKDRDVGNGSRGRFRRDEAIELNWQGGSSAGRVKNQDVALCRRRFVGV